MCISDRLIKNKHQKWMDACPCSNRRLCSPHFPELDNRHDEVITTRRSISNLNPDLIFYCLSYLFFNILYYFSSPPYVLSSLIYQAVHVSGCFWKRKTIAEILISLQSVSLNVLLTLKLRFLRKKDKHSLSMCNAVSQLGLW